jgi:hypothetical protein
MDLDKHAASWAQNMLVFNMVRPKKHNPHLDEEPTEAERTHLKHSAEELCLNHPVVSSSKLTPQPRIHVHLQQLLHLSA